MTTTDKTARYIESLQAKLRAQDTAIAAANGRITRLERDAVDMMDRNTEMAAQNQRQLEERNQVAAAYDAAAVNLAQRSVRDIELGEALKRLIHRTPLLAGASALDILADLPAFIETLLVQRGAALADRERRHSQELAAATELSATLADREAALAAKEVELRALVAKVDDRMRGRERADAAAILNRQLMAGAIPGRNRR